MTTAATTDATANGSRRRKDQSAFEPGYSLTQPLALELSFDQLYVTDRRIASGSFGTVYTCRHQLQQQQNQQQQQQQQQSNNASSTAFDETYAVKILDRAKLKPKDDDAVFREVNILKELRGTPHIMRLVDFFAGPRTLHVVLEYAAGGDVFERLAERKHYTEADARDLSRILLTAVQSLHQQRIVHRDLKPENLLLRSDMDDTSILLADFGFARHVSHDGNCTTRCGTPAFVAPEILIGQPYGTSCDLWSVGCLLYMLMGGYPPFAGRNHRELFRKVRAADFVFHSTKWENVSVAAKHLISQLLTVNVSKRWTAEQALACEWFQSPKLRRELLATRDLSGSLTELKSVRARRSWRAALSAVGWATSAKFWNPDAVSFGQQMAQWDQEMGVRASTSTSTRMLTKFPVVGKSFHDLYELGTKLRKGSSATIWECISKKTRQTLAVKIVDRTKMSSSDDEAVLNEVAILKTLSGHRHVVQLLDFYEETTAFYLVMEYMKGGDVFDQIVKQTHFSETDARDLTSSLLKGVLQLHKAGVAHRDLKPQNLLLDADHPNEMKIGDFGFARRVHTPSSLTTRVGTPTYVAPEILKNIPHDERVDAWSIGVVVFVLLVGYPPFLEDKQADLFHKIRACEWSFVEDDWQHISDEAKQFVSGLLVNDPKDRWTIEEALRSQWIHQDPSQLSNVDVSESLRLQRKRLRGLQGNRLRVWAKAVMFIGRTTRDMDVVEVPTQAQDAVSFDSNNHNSIAENEEAMEYGGGV